MDRINVSFSFYIQKLFIRQSVSMKERKSNKECDNGLIRKYYTNKCSPEERRFVEQCFADEKCASGITDAARQEWETTSSEGENTEVLSNILYEINYNIRLKQHRKLNERKWLDRT